MRGHDPGSLAFDLTAVEIKINDSLRQNSGERSGCGRALLGAACRRRRTGASALGARGTRSGGRFAALRLTRAGPKSQRRGDDHN